MRTLHKVGALNPIAQRMWAEIVAPLHILNLLLLKYPNICGILVKLGPSICLLESKWGVKQKIFKGSKVDFSQGTQGK